jgi:transcriptional regulator with XRE-family HTH domain
MKLAFGENLRRLRREQDLTQEELAEVLNVSCQSVSRWENSTCYPDMELLPTMASFFHTTVDQLLGVSQALEQQREKAYLTQFQEAISVGDISACIEIARKGVAEFPGSFPLRNKLMYALFASADETGNIPNWAENRTRYDAEIVSLGEHIMKFCPDQDIRLEATARLGFHHCEMGRQAQGRAILDTLPPAEFCRENWAWWGLSEEEKLPQTRRQIAQGYSVLNAGLYNLVDGKLLPDEQLIQVYEKIAALQELLFGDYAMNAHFSHAKTCCGMAATYARLGNQAQALKQLKLAADAARFFDQRPEEQTTSCLLLGDRTWHRADFDTADTRTCGQIMAQKWMQSPDFDAMKGTPEFLEILEALA